MPYEVKKSDKCPVSKPYGVFTQGTETMHGCHESMASAHAQMAALYANVPDAGNHGRVSTLTRTLTFDVAERDGDGGIPVVVSSDAVVDVMDGPEILVHSPDAVDLRRAPLPMIATHRSGQINVGLVDNLRIDGGVMRGMARFGVRTEAADYQKDVMAGIIRSVSVGYARLRGKVRGDGVLVTSNWMPTHVAMVAEPADLNAGFFREGAHVPKFELSLETPAGEAAAQPAQPANQGATMSDTAVREEKPAAGAAEQPKDGQQSAAAQPKTADEMAREHFDGIRKFCKANGLDAKYERNWIERNASWNTISDEFLKMKQEQERVAPQGLGFLDMERREQESYSLLRALRASINGDWSKAGLELEANKSVAKRMNKLPRSEKAFFVPLDVLVRGINRQIVKRDMDAAGTSGSNYLISTTNLPGSFIDLLRNVSVGLRLGVTRLPGLIGNVTIPKMTAGNTAYWLADETTQITESQPTIGQVSLSPKNVAALTELSHQLLQQSTPDAEQLVLTSIARDIGLAVDVGILRGSGSTGQPHGIVGTSGVGSFTGTSLASPGILDAQADVAGANALFPGCAYTTTPAVASLLMARPELPSTGTTRLWQGSMMEGSMFGMPALTSAQNSSATMLFGWWPSVILAEWGVLELMTNPYSDFTRGLTAVRGWYTCDVGIRYAAAFSYSSSIT